jgi:ornithine cyclodeaminase/alanine dehydrogenase-like protein (mu-crystallin family)
MNLRVVTASELRTAVSMSEAIDVVEDAFRRGSIVAPQRSRHQTGSGDLLTMPAWNEEALGVKLVTVTPENPRNDLPLIHGAYLLFSAITGEPAALLDAEELTKIRTAAVSGLATRLLARRDARRLVVFGAGIQAAGHIEAMCAVRDIERVTVVSRSDQRAERLAREKGKELGVPIAVGAPETVAEADLICTCTSSPVPVFDGNLVAPGTHINAIGSYTPSARELDDEIMRRAEVVVVESKSVATAEAGDVVLALNSGSISDRDVVGISQVLDDGFERSGAAITVFKSVGMALEDLAVAQAALDRLAGPDD